MLQLLISSGAEMDDFGGDRVQPFMGDYWMLSPTSSNAFFSLTNNNENKTDAEEEEEQEEGVSPARHQTAAGFISPQPEPKTSCQGGGLMERMAARAGFSAPKLNTESIRPSALSVNHQETRSHLAIPPGLSPSTLLDSPVFLSNSLVQSSPTTGKFAFPSMGDGQNATFFAVTSDNNNNDTSSFAFKPFIENVPPAVCPVTVPPNSIYGQQSISEPNAEDAGDPSSVGAPADDGYNWRKYGQKQVRGSEYPRSYYKCTHSNCPVKKKVERSQEGHITEIIYMGAHTHPKPPSNRRAALESENAEQDNNGDWKSENLEVTSSAPLGSDHCEGPQAQNGTHYESGDPVDGSSLFSNDEDEDDRGTNGSVSLGYEGEGDELDSKRRKIETYAADMTGGATRAIREPRVVVQTTSEVDILDDGYRWRKYGQKVVKGNPNPRSYYKCTSAGCTVRKHVERASHDLKSVITTYEGKHNHDVPAARNSNNHHHSHASNPGGSSSILPSQSAHVHRPETPHQQQFAMPHLGSFGFHGGPHLGFNFGMMSQQGIAGMFQAHHPYLGQHQPGPPMNGLVMVKAEPKMELGSDPGLNLSSNDSSTYQQFTTSRLPLGPQM